MMPDNKAMSKDRITFIEQVIVKPIKSAQFSPSHSRTPSRSSQLTSASTHHLNHDDFLATRSLSDDSYRSATPIAIAAPPPPAYMPVLPISSTWSFGYAQARAKQLERDMELLLQRPPMGMTLTAPPLTTLNDMGRISIAPVAVPSYTPFQSPQCQPKKRTLLHTSMQQVVYDVLTDLRNSDQLFELNCHRKIRSPFSSSFIQTASASQRRIKHHHHHHPHRHESPSSPLPHPHRPSTPYDGTAVTPIATPSLLSLNAKHPPEPESVKHLTYRLSLLESKIEWKRQADTRPKRSLFTHTLLPTRTPSSRTTSDSDSTTSTTTNEEEEIIQPQPTLLQLLRDMNGDSRIEVMQPVETHVLQSVPSLSASASSTPTPYPLLDVSPYSTLGSLDSSTPHLTFPLSLSLPLPPPHQSTCHPLFNDAIAPPTSPQQPNTTPHWHATNEMPLHPLAVTFSSPPTYILAPPPLSVAPADEAEVDSTNPSPLSSFARSTHADGDSPPGSSIRATSAAPMLHSEPTPASVPATAVGGMHSHAHAHTAHPLAIPPTTLNSRHTPQPMHTAWLTRYHSMPHPLAHPLITDSLIIGGSTHSHPHPLALSSATPTVNHLTLLASNPATHPLDTKRYDQTSRYAMTCDNAYLTMQPTTTSAPHPLHF